VGSEAGGAPNPIQGLVLQLVRSLMDPLNRREVLKQVVNAIAVAPTTDPKVKALLEAARALLK